MEDLVSERIAFIEAEVERTASSSTPGSAETYSPTRVTDICREFGLQTGDVMDLRKRLGLHLTSTPSGGAEVH